jgi:thiol:disulfide interchange protein DsbD
MKRMTRHLPRACAALLLVSAAGAAVADGGGFLSGLGQKLGLFKQQQSEFLEPDRAFAFTSEVRDDDTVLLRWQIAEGYYLYRDRFAFSLQDSPQVSLGTPALPAEDEVKEDEFFGSMAIYHRQVEVVLPLERVGADDGRVRIEATYQGCAEAGFCYPPMNKTVEFRLPAV